MSAASAAGGCETGNGECGKVKMGMLTTMARYSCLMRPLDADLFLEMALSIVPAQNAC